MSVKREDLHWRRIDSDGYREYGWSEVTPTEFHEIATAEGYVKLDVDVEALRELADLDAHIFDDGFTQAEIDLMWDLARQVLAALDGETT